MKKEITLNVSRFVLISYILNILGLVRELGMIIKLSSDVML